jgi:hypothetical protein
MAPSRFLVEKKIKLIMHSNITNTLHKRQLQTPKQVQQKLTQKHPVLVNADKDKTIVIIHKDTYIQQVNSSLMEN